MRVLIAEDDSISRRILEATLTKWGYDVTIACDGEEAWASMQDPEAPRLVILDWMMPGLNGVEVACRVRALDRDDYNYIILLTAKGRKEDIIEGMDAGADDYITKPFVARELKVRLRAAKRILDLHAELLAAREELQLRATHDALTGLWNRAAIHDVLTRELSRGRRDGSSVGVILGDIDHFKNVNDTYGHEAGDAVLQRAAEWMQASLRDCELIGRYGGEEFLIVAPTCEPNGVGEVAERIRRCFLDRTVTLCSGEEISFTMSLGGVSSLVVPPSADADALIRIADAAMYRAKQTGRNRVVVADAALIGGVNVA